MSKKPSRSNKSKPTSVETAFPITSSVEELPTTIDRVNNINQKEESLYKAGVTRRRTYEVIGELLNAVKKISGTDDFGMPTMSEEPDLQRRKEGAELAMRAFGDSKEFLAVNTQVNNVMDVKAIVEAIARGRSQASDSASK